MLLSRRFIALVKRVGSERLPYGAVMAAGAASQVARLGPLRPLTFPLLLLTLGEALVLAGCFIVRWHRRRGVAAARAHPAGSSRWWESPERQFGLFTVPVGCAVIASGFSAYPSTAALCVAIFALVVALITALALGGGLAALLLAHKPGVRTLDGAWFLAPAAALAIAIALVALLPRLPLAASAGMRIAALVCCGVGVAGYGLTLVLAVMRVSVAGLGALERAPWWVSAGCGGLAAAAVGRVVLAFGPAHDQIVRGLAWIALGTWGVGSALLAPIIVGSIASLLADRWPPRVPPWFPTFSVGVYALGSDLVGSLWRAHAIAALGQVAGVATVTLWAATSALLARRLVREAPAIITA